MVVGEGGTTCEGFRVWCIAFTLGIMSGVRAD